MSPPMSWFSQYRGRSNGRLLHAISIYCDSWPRPSENVICNEGKVTLGSKGRTIATYEWEGDTDIPVFKFMPNDGNLQYSYERDQYYYKPFLDEPELLHGGFSYLVQTLRNLLSLSEAMELRYVRDNIPASPQKSIEERWYWLEECYPKLVSKIKLTIASACHKGYFDHVERVWKHAALCAIFHLEPQNPKRFLDIETGIASIVSSIYRELTFMEASFIVHARDVLGGFDQSPSLESVVTRREYPDTHSIKAKITKIIERESNGSVKVSDWESLAFATMAFTDYREKR